MNSQNRMNAGAEYVLYRIWATLQDRDGIHAESLLACLGSLAGYACQAYVRRAGARGGAAADARGFALTSVATNDRPNRCATPRRSSRASCPHAHDGDDALNLPLKTSPLSVWALVRRSLQKLGKPLPDIESISAHVTSTFGTSEFGVPRAAEGRRPRLLPIVYVTQLWPQVLPIAQRFCRRPAQLPVLFGIALQRALEHTTGRLDPTLGASIAMECAVAMSKVALPATLSELFQAPTAAAPGVALPAARGVALTVAPDVTLTSKRASAAAGRGDALTPSAVAAPARSSAVRATKRRRSAGIDTKALEAGAFRARVRSPKGVATIMSLAIVAVASAAWMAGRSDETPAIAQVAGGLKAPAFRAAAAARTFEQPTQFEQPQLEQPTQFEQSVEQALVDNEAPLANETPPVQESPPEEELPAPPPDQGEGVIAEDWQSA